MKARSIRPWRRLIQTGTALAFLAVPLLNKAEIHLVSGNFLSFNFAGLPLADPLASLQAGLGALGATPAMLIGAGLALALALLMGPVFCSWLCPYGFFSELLHRRKGPPAAPKKAASSGRQSENSPACGELCTDTPAPALSGSQSGHTAALGKNPTGAVSGRPFLGKILLVAAGLLAVLLFAPVPPLNQLSMPGWYSRALQHAVLYREALWGALLLIPAVLLIERLSGKRFWCRYICPQSVLISLAGLLPLRLLRVHFQPRACTCPANDRACLAACSLDLNPRKPGPAQFAQCSNCGDCVDACRDKGRALSFIKRPAAARAGADRNEAGAKTKTPPLQETAEA